MVKEIIHNLNASNPVFISRRHQQVCFILAAFVPGVLTAVNARKFSTIFCLHRQIISIDKII